ncbi:hypothetical protein HY622_02195 [Candidatus Uhrbacteria bacterium]|nr:hypothetical protein [Candidatus Uhrbacteria bacterium]
MRCVLSILAFVLALTFSARVDALSLSTKLKGRILLDVRQKGEAWYVNPKNEQRYFLGRPADAFQVMRQLGLGITNADLEKIPQGDEEGASPLATRLAGRILLQVESNGEAWYVHPTTFKRYFLARPADAFRVMRELGLGITHENLLLVPSAKFDAILLPPQAQAPAMQDKNEAKKKEKAPVVADTATSTEPAKESPVSPTTILYNGNTFAPSSVTIKVGQTVVFRSTGSASMWVASDPHPVHTDLSGFDQQTIGEEYSFPFQKAGTYRFHNHLAPSHGGIIVVQ